jgi:cytochrome c553
MKLPASLLIAAMLASPSFSSFAQQHEGPVPAAAAHAAAAAPQAAKPDPNQGGAKFGAVCAACHGADGNSSIATNPKLAQQHPEYLIKQLQDFKSGKRASPIMQGFASQLTDADMKNIAYWAASQKAKPGFAKDKELAAMGERIYRGGIADRQIAACTGCHGPTGAGVPSQYPRLSGQQAEYVEAQLKAFRDDKRKNSLPMAQVAAKLNDREIHALADYVAGLR